MFAALPLDVRKVSDLPEELELRTRATPSQGQSINLSLTSGFRHQWRIQILGKEFHVSPHAIQIVARLSETVVLARIDNELDRHLAFDQRLIKLLRLSDGHARIDLSVHDHRR